MTDPFDFENRPLFEKLSRAKKITAVSLLYERLASAFWRLISWCLFFFALWFFQIPFMLGNIAAQITFLIFLGGTGYFIYQDVRHFRLPSRRDINRRIEKNAGLRHRPVSTLEDRLANPKKPQTRSLWEINNNRLLATLPRIKPAWPQSNIPEKDPYALRYLALVFFSLGLIIAGPQWKSRLWEGLTPVTFSSDASKADDIRVWITPPDYTGIDPIVLNKENSDKTLEIPEGSVLKANIDGGLGTPYLVAGKNRYPFTQQESGNYTLETPVPKGEKLTISRFYIPKASWHYKLVQDAPPQITKMQEEPEILPEGALNFFLNVKDDYGVQHLKMNMIMANEVEEAPLGQHAEEIRSIMSPPGQDFEIAPLYDLTGHTWAGLPVTFIFEVSDHKGQAALLSPFQVVLPERHFTHPVAVKLIEIRKKLAWSPVSSYDEMGRELENLLSRPGEFQDDRIVFLAIRSAASRLIWANPPSLETAQSIIHLLWDTALRIEDGDLTLAARNLRDAQMALEEALQNPEVSQEEISRLMSELRQAMAHYLMELQKEMQKRMAEGQEFPILPPEMLAQSINPDALASFLDELESHMMSGDKNSAQQMLSQLQRFLDMMNPSMAAPMPQDMQMMSEGINELQELIERQQDLLDQTQKQVEILEGFHNLVRSFGEPLPQNQELMESWGLDEMPPPPKPDQKNANTLPLINTQKNKVEQEALRYILGQLMLDAADALNEIPENMGLAERAMLASSEDLGENRPDASVPHQEEALEHLKQSQEQLSQQLMARMKQMTGMAISGGSMRYDPLGRPYGAHGDQNGLQQGSRVKIPNEAERRKADEILRLLRRRSSELDRPDGELDYYRRLLRRF